MLTLSPSLETARQIAGTGAYNIIPVSTELFADTATPIEVLRKLKAVSGHCFILESAEDRERWGRYTFLGFDPKLEITCLNGTVKITSEDGTQSYETNDPNYYIQNILNQHKSVKLDTLPPFTGGLVGYFAYDYAKYSEPTLELNVCDKEYFQDADLMLFDKVIAFDHFQHKIILIVSVRTENLEHEYKRASDELAKLKRLINSAVQEHPPIALVQSEFKALFSRDAYCSMVEKAKSYIKEGDIFQVVLSNRFEVDFDGSLFDTYRVLRTINPSPYMFYFSGSDLEIAGASPETLVKLHDGKLFTFPLAGTRPRGVTDEEDLKLEQELLADEKELAEHNMLVDLGRNDLGKISRFGTINVDKYKAVLRFSHVMHIGSTVSGDILDGKTGLDAINAVLPAGTLSGAPKIRAMQIINELEQNKRGIYGGAIGYLDFTGNMDVCIAIRIAYRKNGKAFIRSGAGIVADSDPVSEYNECINKSKAVRNALIQSSGGID